MARIILAEDDDSMRSYLVRALERAGHQVKSFSEGASAFEEIKGASFDLLLIPANANAEIDTPFGEPIEGANLFRSVKRVALRHEGDPGP